MESLPVIIILVCSASMIVIALFTSMMLYKHMLEPRPKRDLTINSNIWPLTLPVHCFNKKGQKIRKQALKIVITLIAVVLITLIYIGSILWLN